MRTSADALRSMRRYIWKLLEDDVCIGPDGEARSWEIRYWTTEGTFRWPFGYVSATTPTNYTGPHAVREASKAFTVHLYPVPKLSPEDSILEVERVEELLTVAFETGFAYIDKPDPGDATTWVEVRTGPRRVPLYDYAGVPLDGPASESFARGPSDFLRVSDCPIGRIIDPEDDRYWMVTAEPRVSWRRTGRVPNARKIVERVKLREVPR